MDQLHSCWPDESGVDWNKDPVLMCQGVYISGIEISHRLSHSWICDNNGTFWYLLKDIREIFRKFLMVNVRFITKLWKLTAKTVYQTEGMNTYVCIWANWVRHDTIGAELTEVRSECHETVRVFCLITIFWSWLSVMDTCPNQMSSFGHTFVQYKLPNVQFQEDF